MIREPLPTPLASAAEARRRELPAAVALAILTGGLASAIMGGVGAVGWAALVALLLIADAEIYRRLDVAEEHIEGQLMIALAAWAFIGSSFYAALPAALWFSGQPAGAAAAIVLWVAAVVRHIGRGSSRLPIAMAGAAPPILLMLIAPLAMAAMTKQADWDLAVISAVGGGALMAYVAQARLSAAAAERDLRASTSSENASHTLAQLLFDVSAISATLVDCEGRVVAMSNRVWEGWAHHEAVGRPFEEISPWAPSVWRDAFKRAMAGETVRREEDELTLASGKSWITWEARPWRNAQDETIGVLTYGRDVTATVTARRLAQANEERFRIALDAGRSVVFEIDLKDETLTWFGDPTPFYGSAISLRDFNAATMPQIADDDRTGVQALFDACLAGDVDDFEYRMRMASGEWGWVQTRVRAIPGRSGKTRKIIGITKDISGPKGEQKAFIAAMARAETAIRAKRTLLMDPNARPTIIDNDVPIVDVSFAEMFDRLDNLLDEMDARDALLSETLASLRAARAQAEEASVSKSRFLAGMSHELRTPLNAIIGYSEILLEEAEADKRDTDMKDINRVLASARQLLHLINDILDLSKIEAGRMDVSVAEFNVGDMIVEAIDTMRPSAEKNGNEVVFECDGDLGLARSDSFKLNQCLLNLMSNAVKFTKQGTVIVRAKRDAGDWIDISIIDSGVGMSEEQLARLFQAFVQAETTTAQKFGGTGLGLAITRRLMQMLGGDVSVTSEQGVGSTFTIRWPAFLAEVDARAADTALNSPQSGSPILVIDDEESARDLVSRALSRLGFEVRQAATADAGLALARGVRPSLIVLDINLPDVSGWDLMQILREDPETADIPIVIHSVDDDRKRALTLGACEHLVKPADRDVLAAAVARIIRPQTASAVAGATVQPFAQTA